MKNKGDGTKVLTGLVRFCYPKVFKAEGFKDNPEDNKRYSLGILIPKEDTPTIQLLKDAFEKAKEKGKARFGQNKAIQNFKFIKNDHEEKGFMTDCDEDPEWRENEAYQGHYYLNVASSESNGRPGVLKLEGKIPVKLDYKNEDDVAEIYGGCYGKVTMNLFPYTAGKGGISAGLGNVLKVKDGERFGGRDSAENDFESEFDVEDAMLYTD